MDKYSFIFITNYLNNVWLDKYMENHSELSLEDIKEIDIPNISKEEQMSITNICKSLNKRSSLLMSLLDNDKKIIKEVFNKIL